MKNKLIFPLAIALLMIFWGCEKKTDDPSTDYGTKASGLYTGTWVVVGTGQAAGTCKVVKVSTTSVNLEMVAGGQTLPTIPGVTLSDGGNGKINISYTDSSGTLTGTIDNNSISITLKAGSIVETFTGIK
jgi:hypothetical protein